MRERPQRQGGIKVAPPELLYFKANSYGVSELPLCFLMSLGNPPTSKTQLTAVQAAFNQWQDESGWPLAHISKTLACTVGD